MSHLLTWMLSRSARMILSKTRSFLPSHRFGVEKLHIGDAKNAGQDRFMRSGGRFGNPRSIDVIHKSTVSAPNVVLTNPPDVTSVK